MRSWIFVGISPGKIVKSSGWVKNGYIFSAVCMIPPNVCVHVHVYIQIHRLNQHSLCTTLVLLSEPSGNDIIDMRPGKKFNRDLQGKIRHRRNDD